MGNGNGNPVSNGWHNVVKWANGIGTVTKAVVGLVAVGGIITTGLLFYKPRHEAASDHQSIREEFGSAIIMLAQDTAEARKRVSEYDELGKLETDIDLKKLQIKQFNSISERRPLTADESEELELARDSLSLLQRRLREIQQQMREDDTA